MSNGFVIYRGPSMLNGEPIIVIATGFQDKSNNKKTGGGLIQTWILCEDISPTEAIKTGKDVSICGFCAHRGRIVDGKNVERSCYVVVFQAPLNVWKSYHRGIYPVADNPSELGRGRGIRMGAYGDPAAVPFSVWQAFLSNASFWTGFSHQWRDPRFAELKDFAMASCDNEQDYTDAVSNGWRTFRVRTMQHVAKLPREVSCPASKEMGYKTTCDACKACGGLGAKAKANIVIDAHGSIGKIANASRNIG